MAGHLLKQKAPETNSPALMNVRHARRGTNGFRRYYPEGPRTDKMFDLSGERTHHADACRDPEAIATALGMLRAVSGANRDRNTSHRCLYIIHAVDSDFCKVGVSVDPVERIAAIQTGCPFPLALYACVFSPTFKAGSLEQAIIKRAARKGIGAQGEWIKAKPREALWLALDVAWSECIPICDARTWFDSMRASTLRAARKTKRPRGFP